MKKIITRIGLQLFFLSFFILQLQAVNDNEEKYTWKIGTGRTVITPNEPTWMAGYSSRTSPSEGKLHDLWAKALLLEDARGNRSLLITMDILGVSKDFSDEVRSLINRKYNLNNSQIILSSSHTHSGPVISRALQYIYPMTEQDWKVVDKYTEQLKEKLVELVDQAIKNLQPAHIYTQNGITRFQVNRRNNRENSITPTTELKGPNDYAVPVIKIESPDKQLLAVVFGYACHPTTLSINMFSGDYAGFAQLELEKRYPGVTAMFFQGAGADQNPLPRRTVPLAIQYGKQLAATVERVLSEEMPQQESNLITRYSEIDLLIDDPLPTEELQVIAKGSDYQARWANGIISELKTKGHLIKSYPFPVGYWQIGQQKLFILGGESVIAYSVKLKQTYGEQIFVMSYANDVMGYIPSEVILEEGGYEGDTSQRVYGLPSKWSKSVESKIISELKNITTK
ncbi:neutral/alkaline non-lysosomal ceramidase N-terminal domain-containing protein [Proteiniphilum sp. UBA5431]|uniref:neutral/alkaline non-lysosomal ceramidase N-terminal domain-containing protein n=1 Tax=Dysgonomonadaceae TaxID=2005520 RepID=UPI00257F247F|nr:neutral/alkaline non-lysosomal ceramidase N-terminal domain-containing protein [Proteiniphilum sp. UBA5431]